jgi:hypothetical protein
MSWAFSDESERADRMPLGTVFVEAQRTYQLRKQLRSCRANVGSTWRRKGLVGAGSFLMPSSRSNYQ